MTGTMCLMCVAVSGGTCLTCHVSDVHGFYCVSGKVLCPASHFFLLPSIAGACGINRFNFTGCVRVGWKGWSGGEFPPLILPHTRGGDGRQWQGGTGLCYHCASRTGLFCRLAEGRIAL